MIKSLNLTIAKMSGESLENMKILEERKTIMLLATHFEIISRYFADGRGIGSEFESFFTSLRRIGSDFEFENCPEGEFDCDDATCISNELGKLKCTFYLLIMAEGQKVYVRLSPVWFLVRVSNKITSERDLIHLSTF